MPYAGKTLMPREIASIAFAETTWRNYELTKGVAVALAESAGSLGAWHDNQTVLSECKAGQEVLNPELYYHMTVLNPKTGQVRIEPNGPTEMHPPESEVLTSRDCGLYQINIPGEQIGSGREQALRTTSMDVAEWEPVCVENIITAQNMYNRAWIRNGVQDIRRWQAWVAYTTGWATFPEFWVWKHVDGVPTGPWVKTGRYIQKAIAGQLNFHAIIRKDWTLPQALYYGHRYAKHFGLDPARLKIDSKNDIIGWDVPRMPGVPPSDGIGPRPVPNDGV